MRTRIGKATLLVALVVAALNHPGFSHDASKPDGPYHQTDLPELHEIVETVRQSAGPEQLAKIDQLVATAGHELQRLSQLAVVAHHRKIELMLQDVVDRRAFDEARANELKALSNGIDDTLVSLAKTLTAEQRLQFREHNKPHKD